jgi:hypothetical protein
LSAAHATSLSTAPNAVEPPPTPRALDLAADYARARATR